MHLLPLGAFRPDAVARVISALQSLNAPSGAQCFPTREIEASWAMVTLSQCIFWCSVLSDSLLFQLLCGPLPSLNAPSGAQCFPTMAWDSLAQRVMVSQCTFWCSVLSDNAILAKEETERGLNAPSGAQCFPTQHVHASILEVFWSQCTFWCSVLSDLKPTELPRGL